MTFSVKKAIEDYNGFMYDFCFHKTKPENNDFLGNYGIHDIRDVLNATLVNLGDKYAPILERGINWLRYGIEHNEGLGENHDSNILFHQTNLNESLALGLWLRDNIDDLFIWNKILELHHRSLTEEENPYGIENMATLHLNDWCLRCLMAQQYEKGIDMYRQYYPAEISLKRLSYSERELAYAYCLHYAENCFLEEELFLVSKKFLTKNMEKNWIDKGQIERATIWLKVIYSNQYNKLKPNQILWKAYEHMPKIEKPNFIE